MNNHILLQTERNNIQFEEILSILKSHDYEPVLPLIQNDITNDFSFISAISEALFSTTKYQDAVLNKCLKSLKALLKKDVNFFQLMILKKKSKNYRKYQ